MIARRYGVALPASRAKLILRHQKPTAETPNSPRAIALALVAIFPYFIMKIFNVGFAFASFYGGTSLLIIVGVALDTLQQIESHLLMRHYDGFMKSGKIRGRR